MASLANSTAQVQNKIPTHRLFYLDALRGVAIFFIVWLHAGSYTHHEVTAPSAVFLLKLIDPGVAFFFLTDGFLFAQHVRHHQGFRYVDYLRKSAWRLLFPWLFFTTAYGLFRAGFESIGFFTTHLLVGHTFVENLSSLFNSAIAMQMYFLMSLFLIRVLCPLTRHLAAEGRGILCVAITVVYILLLKFCGFKLGSDPITSAVAGLQYYLLGIIFFHFDGIFRRRSLVIAMVCLLVYGIMVALEIEGLLTFSTGKLEKLAAMTANYALYMYLVKRPGFLVRLGQHTMEIYLLHAPVLLFGFALVASRIIGDPLSLRLVVTMASLLGSFAIGWVVSRIPKGRIIFGEGHS